MTPRDGDPLTIEEEAVGRSDTGYARARAFRDGITANLDVLLLTTAIAAVGWTMPRVDLHGFIVGLALGGVGMLAVFSRRWTDV